MGRFEVAEVTVEVLMEHKYTSVLEKPAVGHCVCGSVFASWEAYVDHLQRQTAEARLLPLPTYLQADAPSVVCVSCGRHSWSSRVGDLCDLPQPDGQACRGKFA